MILDLENYIIYSFGNKMRQKYLSLVTVNRIFSVMNGHFCEESFDFRHKLYAIFADCLPLDTDGDAAVLIIMSIVMNLIGFCNYILE